MAAKYLRRPNDGLIADMSHQHSYLSGDATHGDYRVDPENWAADGLLLVGHGTREEAGVAEFLAVAELVRQRTATLVEPCFLELARPTIAEGVARLAERGARRITVVPVLLFAAGHAKRDIPLAVAETAVRFPSFLCGMPRRWNATTGCVELSARRFREAVGAAHEAALNHAFDAAETLLVMVGRGSSDPSATAEMQRFSNLRRELTPVGGLETCFVARQSPLLADALSAGRRQRVPPHRGAAPFAVQGATARRHSARSRVGERLPAAAGIASKLACGKSC